MIRPEREPSISIGLIQGAGDVHFLLQGTYHSDAGEPYESGEYEVIADGTSLTVRGPAGTQRRAEHLRLSPSDFDSCRATVQDVTIGIDFHWQRREAQQFQGALAIRPAAGRLTVINELPLESYLVSVISSEMSASCPGESLRAHAIVSRSWLLAQLVSSSASGPASGGGKPVATTAEAAQPGASTELVRWYGRESHSDFDVCADDHCQRYQGISKAFSAEAFEAVQQTRGKVVAWDGDICDTRYSKSCGGITEVYRTAWEDRDVPYLTAVYDGPGQPPATFGTPLSGETNAASWIRGAPAAFCNTQSRELLSRILPGFDQETNDFYRWQVTYSAEELASIIDARLGIDAGKVRSIEALERGPSGRIVRLRITGDRRTLIIGKELEIRRALSRSHLYSSAFVVDHQPGAHAPASFTLTGAGWGHGVGLCQIGAAVMADRGFTHAEILSHYFPQTELVALYL